MNDLHFYPTVTNELIEASGCVCSAYELSYRYEEEDFPLKTKGRNPVKIDNEAWNIEKDGLIIKREIIIKDISKLKGPDGVACEAADLGSCIIWNNRALCQIGHFLPTEIEPTEQGCVFRFYDEFQPGQFKGDLTLDTIIYLKSAASKVLPGEEKLMNETGVSLGELDSVTFLFANDYMDFPIKEIKDKDKPLWWIEFNQWEDPRVDQFSADYVCIYLNQFYSYCPKIDDKIKNVELLIEIISTAYLMIVLKIKEYEGALDDTRNDNNLEPGSISKIIHYFFDSCESGVGNSIPEMHRAIRTQIQLMLGGDEQ